MPADSNARSQVNSESSAASEWYPFRCTRSTARPPFFRSILKTAFSRTLIGVRPATSSSHRSNASRASACIRSRKTTGSAGSCPLMSANRQGVWSQRLQCLIESVDEEVRVFSREGHGRPYFQDIVVDADPAEQHSVLVHPVDEPLGLRRRGLLREPVADQLYGKKHAGAAHVADERMALLESREFRERVLPDAAGVLDQTLVLQNIEHGHADGGGHGVPAEGIEIHVPFREGVDEFGTSDHAGKGVSITHGLAQGDDVGNDPKLLMPPQVSAHAPKATLHLVGDEESARGMHVCKSLRHEPGWHRGQSFAGERRAK